VALIDEVRSTCQALAPSGWRDLLLRVTDGGFDLLSDDLAGALTSPIATIDRTVPGFEDFAAAGTRAIEPGSPAMSLLYHALASPLVNGVGTVPLEAFPTLAQIESVENYVYASTASQARTMIDGNSSAIVVFALEYRPAARTPHLRHADLCFSRTGVARVGTTDPFYDAPTRQWAALDDTKPFAFRPRPVRYAPFVAVSRTGTSGEFPDRFVPGDDQRSFWVPIHKLFDGPECIDGIDIELQWSVGHVNEKLRRLHATLQSQGYDTGWSGSALDEPPFVTTDGIAELYADDVVGQGHVFPTTHERLIEPATINGAPLTISIPAGLKPARSHSEVLEIYFSGLEVSPFGPKPPVSPGQHLLSQGRAHPAPEIINARHELRSDGSDVNLNDLPGVKDTVMAGGYQARHYVDFSGDGWVGVQCPALTPYIPQSVAAYSLVSGPDFFPYCDQLQLMEWASTLPADIRDGLWAVLPRALSDTRLPPNQTLSGGGFAAPTGAGFDDTTVTAVVCQHIHADQPPGQWSDGGLRRQSGLPDAAAGVFDPGWDVSTDQAGDITPGHTDDSDPRLFLSAYGLGTPFVEDVKICAALGTYWPAVAPDATRTFQPDKFWPTVSPLTDAEIGIIGDMPWDGITGPVRLGNVVEYTDIDYADYVDVALANRFTAALVSKVDFSEYTRRVWAMAWLYDALGVRLQPGTRETWFQRIQDFLLAKAEWTLLSFRSLVIDDVAVAAAAAAAGATLEGGFIYGGTIYRHGADNDAPDFRLRHVEILEERQFFTDLRTMLTSADGHTWTSTTIPTSSS
jgi:hypothetical protein